MLNRLVKPRIRNSREVWFYVATVVGACSGFALMVEIVNQWLFFTTWATAMRQFVLSSTEALVLSTPISFCMARTHLEVHAARQEAERASRIDPLTGLSNRRALVEAVAHMGCANSTLMIADIDFFKRVNDTHGHLVGDHVIALVAKLLAKELSDLGVLARVGGEEFALLSPDTAPEQIRARLEAARRRVCETPLISEGRQLQVTISMGVAGANPDESFEHLFGRADRALYVAKASGRNRLLEFEETEPPAGRELAQQAA